MRSVNCHTSGRIFAPCALDFIHKIFTPAQISRQSLATEAELVEVRLVELRAAPSETAAREQQNPEENGARTASRAGVPLRHEAQPAALIVGVLAHVLNEAVDVRQDGVTGRLRPQTLYQGRQRHHLQLEEPEERSS